MFYLQKSSCRDLGCNGKFAMAFLWSFVNVLSLATTVVKSDTSTSLVKSETSPRPCVDDDWQFSFSQCETRNNRRSRRVLAYALQDTCRTYLHSSRPLPKALLDVPCETPCEPNEYLAANLSKSHDASDPANIHVGCRRCQDGTFSLGGGYLIDGSKDSWKPLPEGMSTYCVYRGLDRQWHVGGNGSKGIDFHGRKTCVIHLVSATGQTLTAETLPGLWNSNIPDANLIAPLVQLPSNNKELCDAPTGEEPFRGAVVLVFRGVCTFSQKAFIAERAGAVAIVIYDHNPRRTYFYIAPADPNHLPQIPIFQISREDGERWKAAALPGNSTGGLGGLSQINIASTHCSEESLELAPTQPSNSSHRSVDSWVASIGYHNCRAWTRSPDGRYLHSGDNSGYHIIESYLLLSLNFVRDGSLSFRFNVEAEPMFDGLAFSMDAVEVMKSTSRTTGYVIFSTKVPAGWHNFRWVYHKDLDTSYRRDKATLQLLEVIGTAFSDLECRECRGNLAPAAKLHCSGCGRDEYADLLSTGNTSSGKGRQIGECLPCPHGFTSPPHSISREACHRRPACTEWDVEYHFTDCKEGKATMFKKWRTPLLCDPSAPGSRELLTASNVTVKCPSCQPNEHRVAGGHCEPHILTCPRNQYSSPELIVNKWFTWPKKFSTELLHASSGEHRGGRLGWQLDPHGQQAVVGGHTAAKSVKGEDYIAAMHLDVKLESTGNATFFFSSKPETSWKYRMTVILDGTMVDIAVTEIKQPLKASFSVPAGIHRITWAWDHSTRLEGVNDSADGLSILNITVGNVVGAGSSPCRNCPPGHHVSRSGTMCLPCRKGSSSTKYQKYLPQVDRGCWACPEGRAALQGQSTCHSCGPGLISEPGEAHCLPSPVMELQNSTQGSRIWNARALWNGWRDVTKNGNSSDRGFAPVKVEDHYYYLGVFHYNRAPKPILPVRQGGEDILKDAFWWEWIPPHEDVQLETGEAAEDYCSQPFAVGSMVSVATELKSFIALDSDDFLGLIAEFYQHCDGKRRQTAKLLFKCNPSAAFNGTTFVDSTDGQFVDSTGHVHVPGLRFAKGQPPLSRGRCEDVSLEWHTPLACPLCRPADWGWADGVCSRGIRTVSSILVRTCVGGAVGPESFIELCHRPFTFKELLIVIGVTGAALLAILIYTWFVRRRYKPYMVLKDTPPSLDGEAIGKSEAIL